MEREREKQAIIDRKRAEQAKKEELGDLFKPIQVQQKVPFGVNPKTILCAFHKAGTCTKGDRCKFSHDLNIERKTTKRDLYTDNRDDEKKNGVYFCLYLLESTVTYGYLLFFCCLALALTSGFYFFFINTRYNGQVGPGEAGVCCQF